MRYETEPQCEEKMHYESEARHQEQGYESDITETQEEMNLPWQPVIVSFDPRTLVHEDCVF